jgi:hypothetical protein
LTRLRLALGQCQQAYRNGSELRKLLIGDDKLEQFKKYGIQVAQ